MAAERPCTRRLADGTWCGKPTTRSSWYCAECEQVDQNAAFEEDAKCITADFDAGAARRRGVEETLRELAERYPIPPELTDEAKESNAK